MQIRKDVSSENIEEYIKSIDETDREIILPTSIKYAQMGGESSLVQFLITWAIATDFSAARLYAESSRDHQVVDLVSRAYGLISALSVSEMRDRSGGIITNDVRKIALRRLEILEGEYTRSGTKGPAADLICADHLGYGRPALLYRNIEGGRRLREEREFWTVAKMLINIVVPQAYTAGMSEENRVLGSFLYEVFKNTEEHALSDFDGRRMRFSLRGAMFRYYVLGGQQISERLAGSPLLDAMAQRSVDPDKSGNRHFVELSVFDTGPGFAARLRGKSVREMTLMEEYEAVSHCFLRNVTSKSSARFGQGLPYIVQLLRKHGGYFRIRTGRLSLCFNPMQLQAGDERLVDTSGRGMAEHGEVRGALLSLVLPLRSYSEKSLPLPL